MPCLRNLFRCKRKKQRNYELAAPSLNNNNNNTGPPTPPPARGASPNSLLAPVPEEPPFVRLPLDVKVEEEVNPGYKKDTWYHVRIGEVIYERYLVCTKLGWGDTSTVWLARDLRTSRYVSLKVCANPDDQRLRELDLLLHITQLYSNHPGAQNVATLLDHFAVERRGRRYMCLVSDVLGPSLAVRVRSFTRELDIDWLVDNLYRLLQAVDFLHSEAHIVHGDIWPPNVLCALPDRKFLEDLENLEATEPSDRKVDGGRIIYKSRSVQLPPDLALSSSYLSRIVPVLIDFGNSRLHPDAQDLEHMRTLREADSIRADLPHPPQRDIQWIGRLFVGLMEGRVLYKKTNPMTKTVAEEALKAQESNLRALIWRMKNIPVPSKDDSVEATEEAQDESNNNVLTVKGLLQDPIFGEKSPNIR
ncbi:hypothetical protein LQW54_004998 [Pestalotiopsis sp. IQ-011]